MFIADVTWPLLEFWSWKSHYSNWWAQTCVCCWYNWRQKKNIFLFVVFLSTGQYEILVFFWSGGKGRPQPTNRWKKMLVVGEYVVRSLEYKESLAPLAHKKIIRRGFFQSHTTEFLWSEWFCQLDRRGGALFAQHWERAQLVQGGCVYPNPLY